MNKHLSWALLLTLSMTSSAWAIDSVKKTNGQSVTGTLQGVTAKEVTVAKQTGGNEVIPSAEVETIYFDGEPTQLRSVRSNAANGSFAAALSALARIDPASVTKPEIKAEMEFLKAYCEAKQALGGGGNNLQTAGKAMRDFVSQNPDSYHALQANELLGDLYVAAGDFTNATKHYDVLAQSSSPEYQARAAVAKGRGLLAENKPAEAMTLFESAITSIGQVPGGGAGLEDQKFAAMLGKAACLAAQNQADQGITLVEQSIQGINPEASDLLGQAYLTLGECYEKKGDKKKALREYLHVDLLYPTNPQVHVAALKRLAALFNDLGKPERALEAAQTLKDRYNATVGAK